MPPVFQLHPSRLYNVTSPNYDVIDLPDLIRTVSSVGAWAGSDLRESIPLPSPARGLLQVKFIDSALDCPTVWWPQARDATCIMHPLDQSFQGRALPSEPETLNLLCNQLLDFWFIQLAPTGMPVGWGSRLVAHLV
ncbi:hypothetical protein MAE02_38100 [Microvirga aerophila]|uniref:Uncharacterized protein n=1 Tax=Microvirga aerophila TaxID=670291 RepID=A0A512BVX0_9HYPH|nr:hypothetical protein MAE02_38100 [Microvirga aerophila]